jgi:hypothetical protein
MVLKTTILKNSFSKQALKFSLTLPLLNPCHVIILADVVGYLMKMKLK